MWQGYNKYRNSKITIDGITFDSVLESERWSTLKMLEMVGTITDLKRQPEFEIIPAVKWNGRTLRAKKYRADFIYRKDGVDVVEDVKGVRTREYILKRQEFLLRYGHLYKFIEVEKDDV